jgi:hypothetical protein
MANTLVSPRTWLALTIGAVGLIALAVGWSTWPWGTIGGLLALAGVVLMLLRDRIVEYADDFRGRPDAENLARSGWRPAARRVHPLIYAIGIPLVLLGAIFQVLGNPSDKLTLRAKEIPRSIVFMPVNANRLEVDLSKLDEALNTLVENQRSTSGVLGNLYHPELLVVNCGGSKECVCPDGYARVKDDGKWNLNSGTTGDSIGLCSVNRKYDDVSK